MPSHFKGPEEQVRALSAFINLVRASDSMIDKTSQHVEESGLTQGQFAVLEALHHLGPMCQHALAKKLLRSGGNTTVVIDNLERSRWVKRVRSKSDRRQIEIHLTPKGKRLIEQVFPEHAKVVEKLMAGLTPEEQDELRRIAAKLGCTAAQVCPGLSKKGEPK
jgi:MarR family transcriptional regulator, 2-MHQ and catechol-resistance regulon repressor